MKPSDDEYWAPGRPPLPILGWCIVGDGYKEDDCDGVGGEPTEYFLVNTGNQDDPAQSGLRWADVDIMFDDFDPKLWPSRGAAESAFMNLPEEVTESSLVKGNLRAAPWWGWGEEAERSAYLYEENLDYCEVHQPKLKRNG